MKTTVITSRQIHRKWHLVDMKGKVLGRESTKIASLLLGKGKAGYAPNLDVGDYVVVVNAAELVVTGKKLKQKMYARHSGYPGGFKEVRLDRQLAKDSTQVVRHAVAGMLPKNKLRDGRLKRLKVFAGADHSYDDKFKN